MNYPSYPAYRKTDVPWLGDIPEHWKCKRLRFSVRLNPSKSEIDLAADSLVSFVPMEAVGEYGGLELSEEKPLYEVGGGYTYFADGDVVVAKITPCFENGKGAIAEELRNGVAFGTTELHVVRPEEELDNRFLFYLTISEPFRRVGESTMYGAGGQKRISDDFIKDYVSAIPPIKEQKLIVRFLDQETTCIDALIEKKRRLLELLEEKRLAVITRAVTKGLDPDVPMKDSKIEWLGEVPEHWDVTVPIKRFVSSFGGSTPSTTNPDFWNGEIPWVSPKDMKVDEVKASIDTVTEKALHDTNLKLIKEGAVLIVVRGMILAHSFPVAQNVVPITINQDMKALVPQNGVLPKYLAWYLRGVSKYALSLVDASAHGTKILRTDQFEQIIVPQFSEVEQQEIADFIEKEVGITSKLIASIQLQIKQLNDYRIALITNAVTGKIDVRNLAKKGKAS